MNNPNYTGVCYTFDHLEYHACVNHGYARSKFSFMINKGVITDAFVNGHPIEYPENIFVDVIEA